MVARRRTCAKLLAISPSIPKVWITRVTALVIPRTAFRTTITFAGSGILPAHRTIERFGFLIEIYRIDGNDRIDGINRIDGIDRLVKD